MLVGGTILRDPRGQEVAGATTVHGCILAPQFYQARRVRAGVACRPRWGGV